MRSCAAFVVCVLVAVTPRAARAAYPGTCQTTDCDGDGKNNYVDSCPSGHAQALTPSCSTATCPAPKQCFNGQCLSTCGGPTEFPCIDGLVPCCIDTGTVSQGGTCEGGVCLCFNPGTCTAIGDGGTGTGGGGPTDPEQSFAGFQDIGCYDTLLPPTPGCIPVAARRFDETVPFTALRPGTGLHRVGFTYIGVYDPNTAQTIGTPAAALPQAAAADVRNGFLSVKGVPKNALFACMGAVEFTFDGGIFQVTPTVYGFRAVANFARAIEEAGRPEGQAAFENFSDGMGLLRDVQLKGSPALRPALKGWNGQVYDSSRWSTGLSSLTGASGSDLPAALSTYVDRDCYRDSFLPPLQIGPFGPEFLLLSGQLPKADACMRSFPDGGSALVFTDFSFAVGDLRDSTVLRSWRDYFQSAVLEEANAFRLGISVSIDGPVAFPRAVDEFTQITGNDTGYLWRSPSTWLLNQVRPATPPPYHAIMIPPGVSSSERIGAYLGSPPGSANGDWVVIRGAAFVALNAVDMSLDPPALVPDTGSGSAPFDVTHLFVSPDWTS